MHAFLSNLAMGTHKTFTWQIRRRKAAFSTPESVSSSCILVSERNRTQQHSFRGMVMLLHVFILLAPGPSFSGLMVQGLDRVHFQPVGSFSCEYLLGIWWPTSLCLVQYSSRGERQSSIGSLYFLPPQPFVNTITVTN